MFAMAGHLTVPASTFHSAKKAPRCITNRHLVNRRGSDRSVHRNHHAARRSGGASRHQPSDSGRMLPSLGSMIAASGVYLEARAIQPPEGINGASVESKNSNRWVRGGCDVCHGDSPVIHCKVHQVHLCANCLGRHYDFRTCAYAPSTRGAGAKTGKAFPRLAASSLADPLACAVASPPAGIGPALNPASSLRT